MTSTCRNASPSSTCPCGSPRSGHTTKQHKSATLRRNSGRSNYPATHPGHFAVDVTRCDNLVWDDVYERVYSVEIITIISVPEPGRRRLSGRAPVGELP
jgi:hypothetical protein